jgi:hypothetical protein
MTESPAFRKPSLSRRAFNSSQYSLPIASGRWSDSNGKPSYFISGFRRGVRTSDQWRSAQWRRWRSAPAASFSSLGLTPARKRRAVKAGAIERRHRSVSGEHGQTGRRDRDKAIRGETIAKVIDTGTKLVTSENADEFLKQFGSQLQIERESEH